MKSRYRLLALIWIPFLSLFLFAAPVWGGDSYSHVLFHVFALAVLALGVREIWGGRAHAPTRAQRTLLGVLSATVPVAMIGHGVELVSSIARLADEGWANVETEDIFTEGAHAAAANVTVPMMLISMVTAVVLVAVTAAQQRRSGPAPGWQGAP